MAGSRGTGAGPWRASDAARPLHWWDERGLERLAQALRDTLALWRAAWGVSGEDSRPGCRPAGTLPPAAGRWHALQGNGIARAWLCLPDDSNARLQQALFPGAASCGPLARALADSCRQDAMARLAGLLGLACDEAGSPPEAAIMRVGSGAAEADLAAALSARLLVGPEAAARWREGSRAVKSHAHRAPLVAATAALAHRPLALQVELEGCELDVGALQELQVGDVVRLGHALHDPASVRHAGLPLCHAYLGRRGSRKAIELAGRLHPAAGEVSR
jgi:hypothetical protein